MTKLEKKARRGEDHVDLPTIHIQVGMETCRGTGLTGNAGWPTRKLHANIFGPMYGTFITNITSNA